MVAPLEQRVSETCAEIRKLLTQINDGCFVKQRRVGLLNFLGFTPWSALFRVLRVGRFQSTLLLQKSLDFLVVLH